MNRTTDYQITIFNGPAPWKLAEQAAAMFMNPEQGFSKWMTPRACMDYVSCVACQVTLAKAQLKQGARHTMIYGPNDNANPSCWTSSQITKIDGRWWLTAYYNRIDAAHVPYDLAIHETIGYYVLEETPLIRIVASMVDTYQ